NSPSNSSRTGAIILHGPHQGAQKSTNTKPSEVFSAKSLSCTSIIAILIFLHSSITYLLYIEYNILIFSLLIVCLLNKVPSFGEALRTYYIAFNSSTNFGTTSNKSPTIP